MARVLFSFVSQPVQVIPEMVRTTCSLPVPWLSMSVIVCTGVSSTGDARSVEEEEQQASPQERSELGYRFPAQQQSAPVVFGVFTMSRSGCLEQGIGMMTWEDSWPASVLPVPRQDPAHLSWMHVALARLSSEQREPGPVLVTASLIAFSAVQQDSEGLISVLVFTMAAFEQQESTDLRWAGVSVMF